MRQVCLGFFVFILFIFYFRAVQAHADDSCALIASVSPSSINVDSASNLNFRVDNEGSSEITQVKITTYDNSLWSVVGGSAAGWIPDSDGGSQVIFTDSSLSSGNRGNFTVNTNVNSNVSDGTFFVEVNTSASTTCSFALNVSAVNPATLGLSISNVTVAVDATTATISWNTNQDSDSIVYYGDTSSYGQTQNDNGYTSSHSIKLNSLSSSAAYHFKITSNDSWGDQAVSEDNVFTTASGGKGVSPTIINITNTTVKTNTVTKEIKDTTDPSVNVSTVFSMPFSKSPRVVGKATDDKSVSRIEYSLDGGKNWLPVDKTSSLYKTSTDFSFTPVAQDDGNYDLVVRATDASGNIGKSKKYTFVIDRLPPGISGLLYSFGPQVLNPDENGAVNALAGLPISVTLSAVGGPIEAKITAKNLKTNEVLNYSLSKNTESGLWRGKLSFSKTGEYSLTLAAKDGAGNVKEQKLNNVLVGNSGLITSAVNKQPIEGKITVYYQDLTTGNWLVWDGNPYGQENQIKIDKNGNYNLFLPTGKYYLHIDAPGYKAANSSFFELKEGTPINANFSLKPLKLVFGLGPFKLYWPDFSAANVEFNNLVQKSATKNSLIGKSAPYFKLDSFISDSFLGKPSIITFINTWNPLSSEQMLALERVSHNKNFNIIVIDEGEKSSKANIWKKIGNYSVTTIVDVDATLVSLYNLNSLPTSFFIDKKGIIRKVVSGSWDEGNITKTLNSFNN